jgi:hypothetical protein
MSPEHFDNLTRLWVMAPSRRVFLLQVGTVLAYGALGRVGIRFPRWLGDKENAQCMPNFRYRDGAPCGSRPQSCGICQSGRCIASVDSACQATNPCLRCDPDKITCTKCPKDQECCKDGCCDGKCTADGACCPKAQQCGKNNELCCRECETCDNGTCKKLEGPCPEKTHRVDPSGCCVCRTRLCGGKCCDAPCIEGKCCEECGLDRAACCDGRKCCRERCMDPAAAEKCCECFEDVTEAESKEILDRAKEWQKYQRDNKTPYGQEHNQDPRDPAPKQMDCSYFVQKAVGSGLLGHMYNKKITKRINGKPQEVDAPERLTTLLLDGNCFFRRLGPEETPRAGDLVAQPRPSGAPGSMHVGVATGASPSQGSYRAIAMGGSAEAGSTNELTWGKDSPKGLPGGDQFRAYRPQKCKKGCEDCRP